MNAGEASQAAPSHSVFGAWVLASRPKTLFAAVSPVLVGAGVAGAESRFSLLPALMALLGALILQVLSNFANDYFDFKKGTDTDERLGPLRAAASGLLTPSQMKRGILWTVGAALVPGIYLVYRGGWPIAVLGAAAVICAVWYTAGRWSLGYLGLGDLFVFVFFGPGAVVGTVYVQSGTAPAVAWIASIPAGFLTVAILVVNNTRDHQSDRAASKHTLPARFGPRFGRGEYLALVLASYATVPILALSGGGAWTYLAFASIPFAFVAVKDMLTLPCDRRMNKLLADTGRLLFVFCAALAVGLVL